MPAAVDRRTAAALAAGVGLTLLAGCGRQPPRPPVEPSVLQVVPEGRWPRLSDTGETGRLESACAATGSYLEGLPADRELSFGGHRRTVAELDRGLRRACEILTSPMTADQRMSRLRDEFVLLRSSGRDGRGEVLVTGYFEPVLDARREPLGTYVHPIYGVPGDLVTVDLETFGVDADQTTLVGRLDDSRLVPYPDREAIDFETSLPGSAPRLAYLDDPVELFFLHVQGSGTLRFPDGERVRVGYAASNGRQYRSIGRLLIDEGAVSREQMSMQAITAYLRDHPEELPRVLGFNPRYVFFRTLPATGGPLGCYGEAVTAGRSIATDRRLFPAPAMAWIRGTVPGDRGDESISRFVLNQDTGGSISGPGRVDLFFGRGSAAGELAGRTKHTGELYFLLPKTGDD